MIDPSQPVTQEQFAALVGITRQAVGSLLTRGILTRDDTLADWLLAYCSNLRENAAGRAANGELNLAAERARLAKEQANRVARENAIAERKVAPIAVIEFVLAQVSRQLVGILESIPVQLKRHADLPREALELITVEINAARARAANIELKLDELDVIEGLAPTTEERPDVSTDPPGAGATGS